MDRSTLKTIFLATCLATACAFAPSSKVAWIATSSITTQPHSALSAATVATPPSPLTAWGDTISDIRKLQQEFRKEKLPDFAPEISAKDVGIASDDTQAQLEYFQENAMDLKQKMLDHGAVVLRGFDLMKEQEGFQAFYNAIGMKICQDPLQSVSARPTADGKKDSPVYEAVNKESRKNFFIGKMLLQRRIEVNGDLEIGFVSNLTRWTVALFTFCY
jgi:hypothetical protein